MNTQTQTLWAPIEVVNDTTHRVSTRLIWLLLGLRSSGAPSSLTDTRLRKQSGLDRKTIAAARATLAQEPLAPCCRKPHPSCAAIPVALLTSAEISAGARLLYGQLQGVPNFDNQVGSFTYGTLSRLTGTSVNALKRAVAELVAAGWLTITQGNRRSPISFTLRNPASTRLKARISLIRRKVRKAQYRGETLLREFLNLLIALDDYEDDASPDELLNPFTRELMELDRYYPTAGVAVEYNGDQHYEETDLATFEETVKQVGRDAMKAFICKARGIELAVIRPEDLTLKSIERKLPGRLPRRDLQGMEPLVAALEAWRRSIGSARWRSGPANGEALETKDSVSLPVVCLGAAWYPYTQLRQAEQIQQPRRLQRIAAAGEVGKDAGVLLAWRYPGLSRSVHRGLNQPRQRWR